MASTIAEYLVKIGGDTSELKSSVDSAKSSVSSLGSSGEKAGSTISAGMVVAAAAVMKGGPAGVQFPQERIRAYSSVSARHPAVHTYATNADLGKKQMEESTKTNG